MALGQGGALNGVSKRYSRKGPWILRDVDLDMRPGSCSLIVGGNGSGKSTLARVAAGVTPPNSGRVARSSSVGYVPERLAARNRLTGADYLAHMGRIRGLGRTAINKRSRELLERLDLRPGPDVPADSLSKGNRQKLVIAQAFLAPAGLLVLDEPYGGLDVTAHGALTALIREALAVGSSVLVTAHRADAAPSADHVFGLGDGRLVTMTLPDHHPDTADKRVDLVATARAETQDQIARLRGVLSLRSDAAGRSLTLIVGNGRCDDVLRAAIAQGWSVASVGPHAPEDRPS